MLAYVFPGQGSQVKGMGADLCSVAGIKKLFDTAADILGYDIAEVMFEDPNGELTSRTSRTQAALYLHSVALASLLTKKADMVCGHSIGELAGTYMAGAIADFETGMSLVKARGELMEKTGAGTMAAVLGLPDHQVQEICVGICGDGENVGVAAFNAPLQMVLSGTFEGVARAGQQAKEAGARAVMPLKVSRAFHNPGLMEPARQAFLPHLDGKIRNPTLPIYMNYSGDRVYSSETEVAYGLWYGLVSPVHFRQCVEKMIEDGARKFVEIGSGNVLQGLIKRIAKSVGTDVAVFGVSTLKEAEEFNKI